jgi:copper transport protein
VTAVLAGAPVLDPGAKTAYVTARAIEYLATAIFFGGLTFLAAMWPDGAATRGARTLLGAAWCVGAASTVSALSLESAWAGNRSAWDLFDPDSMPQLLTTDFGRQWSAMALLWVLALVLLGALLRRGPQAARSLPWRVGLLAVGLGTLRVFGLTGHARETAHPVLAQLADLVHVGAMCVWIGGLVMLAGVVLPRRRVGELAQVLPRYSLSALLCVSAMVASGAVLAWSVLGTVGAVRTTTYGHVLLVKLGVLALVLAAAFGSKTWVEHRLDFAVILRGESGTGIRLIRPFVLSVVAETGLLALVLAIASVLVTADPGR